MLGTILVEAQHDHGPLLRRELGQRVAQGDAAHGRLVMRLPGLGLLGQFGPGQLDLLASAPRDGLVHQGFAGVRLGITVGDLGPVRGDTDKDRLQQILGEMGVPGEQVRRPHQRLLTNAYELLEPLVTVHVSEQLCRRVPGWNVSVSVG